MKRFIFFAQACFLSVFVLPLSLCAQDSDTAFPNYVVIGAFARQENAINFTDEAKHNRYPARFEMNPNRNLYYVYVLTTDDREYARAEALRLRAETKYFDAWVYSGAFGNIKVSPIDSSEQQDFNPVTGHRFENVHAGENPVSTGQTNIVPGKASNLPEKTTSENRRVTNKPGQDTGNMTTEPERRDVQNTSARKQSTMTGSPNENNRTDQRQPDATARLNGEERNAEGDTQRVEQTPLPSDGAIQNNNARQRQANAKNSVSKKGTYANASQQSDETSQAYQETSEQQQRDPVSPQGTNTTLADNTGAGTTVTESQQTSGRSQNKTQAPTGSVQGDASLQKDLQHASEALVNIPAPVRQSTEPLSSEELVGKNFYFHLYRADNQKTIPGEVDAIDFEKSRKMGTYPANEGVKVTMAGGKMKHISFVCQVFGYRKQQQEFDPENPSAQLYLDDKGNLVVPFELVRLQKGDIAIMYNVFFFKDAAVMRPESRYEVNNLLDLLVENPSYKITIHGHTNGNASGKIIRMEKDGNFYSLSGTKQGFGSAKQLSEERAVVIRDFLISSGIAADRMQVKAWGGKKRIHDKHSVRAQENVRVEIEILSQ